MIKEFVQPKKSLNLDFYNFINFFLPEILEQFKNLNLN